NAQNADEVPQVLIAEVQILHHEGKKRSDDPAIETYQAEPEAQQSDCFPLVRFIERARFLDSQVFHLKRYARLDANKPAGEAGHLARDLTLRRLRGGANSRTIFSTQT